MRRLDEAAAAAAAYSGSVGSRAVVGEICCKLMVAGETAFDVPHAEQWHQVFQPGDRCAAVRQQEDRRPPRQQRASEAGGHNRAEAAAWAASHGDERTARLRIGGEGEGQPRPVLAR